MLVSAGRFYYRRVHALLSDGLDLFFADGTEYVASLDTSLGLFPVDDVLSHLLADVDGFSGEGLNSLPNISSSL